MSEDSLEEQVAKEGEAVWIASTDWSSLMTELQVSLTRAEDELRLIHMDPKHRHLAKGHLIVARATLRQLEDWI